MRILSKPSELKTSRVIGVHGTSVEVAVAILNKGKFEPEEFSRKTDPCCKSDSIHFVANMEHYKKYFEKRSIYHDAADTDYMIRATSGWAKDIAFRHYMAIQTNDAVPLHWERILWNGSFTNPQDLEVEYREAAEHLKSKGISQERLHQLVKTGVERKGCLIGLNENCLELRISQGDCDGDPEAKLIMPAGGLGLKYIWGIVPLGSTETEILSSQNQNA
ncbi:hypothetical protein HY450_00135 [Candidatus Pacearchaeota archaeon]|nr:hypothetical protein [Candidatus Pacearchaeota archaeon]